MVNLKKIFSTTQLHKFTVYTKDGEDLHKEPPPWGGDLGKCRLENSISFSSMLLWFHKMSCICKQYIAYPLFEKLEKWHHSLFKSCVRLAHCFPLPLFK